MQTGRDYVDGLLPQPLPATPAATDTAHQEALQCNAADWAQDPEQQATNQHLIDVQFGTHQRELQQARSQLDQAVLDWLARRDAEGKPQTERPPPALWKQLDPEQRQRIDAQLAANARGEVSRAQEGGGVQGVNAGVGVLARGLDVPIGQMISGLASRTMSAIGASGGAAAAAAGAALPFLLTPGNIGDGRYYDLGDGLRAYYAPGGRSLTIQRRSAADGSWQDVPVEARVGGVGTQDRPGFAINRSQLEGAIGADRAAEVARVPGVTLMDGGADESGKKGEEASESPPGIGHNSGDKPSPNGDKPPTPPLVATDNPDASKSQEQPPNDEIRQAAQLIASHAYQEHVLVRGEFPGINSLSDFAQHIESIMLRPTESYVMRDGRALYWDGRSQTLVIRDPDEPHGGTIFKPGEGRKYYDNMKRRDEKQRR